MVENHHRNRMDWAKTRADLLIIEFAANWCVIGLKKPAELEIKARNKGRGIGHEEEQGDQS